MDKLTFHKQIIVSLFIQFVCFVLAMLSQQGIFHNVGLILIGALWVLHPVEPPLWELQPTVKSTMRVAGVIVIIAAVFIRFGA